MALRSSVSPTKRQIKEARDWIKECYWSDLPPEDVKHLTDGEVVAGIAQHYDGGWEQFIQDM